MSRITTAKFFALANDIRARFPRAELVHNEVGNLAIMHGHRFIGYVDLTTYSVELFTTDDTNRPPAPHRPGDPIVFTVDPHQPAADPYLAMFEEGAYRVHRRNSERADDDQETRTDG